MGPPVEFRSARRRTGLYLGAGAAAVAINGLLLFALAIVPPEARFATSATVEVVLLPPAARHPKTARAPARTGLRPHVSAPVAAGAPDPIVLPPAEVAPVAPALSAGVRDTLRGKLRCGSALTTKASDELRDCDPAKGAAPAAQLQFQSRRSDEWDEVAAKRAAPAESPFVACPRGSSDDRFGLGCINHGPRPRADAPAPR